ncbi:spore coat protein D [Desulfosporosinus sp.]|uniref:spore coat protein D n=1 Tax=Desulfosporosinus sp. TaxID=157907 RepID=UPI000E801288|nr:spore coat protein D [Desulfosporosinus sp.]MBC2724143.1 spore coat protein D [Desulfosporosinus sp.]MBC2724904.1 spore coat protein D [Desulfosporosinus sp.]HBV87851.1 spore coat protein D [Desulfosporosinus sp.]
MHGNCCKPICCPPQYCVRDFYAQRLIPVIHPVVNINRQNIIDVPQHIYQQTSRNVVVEQGFQAPVAQGRGFLGGPGFLGGNQGFAANRLFF